MSREAPKEERLPHSRSIGGVANAAIATTPLQRDGVRGRGAAVDIRSPLSARASKVRTGGRGQREWEVVRWKKRIVTMRRSLTKNGRRMRYELDDAVRHSRPLSANWSEVIRPIGVSGSRRPTKCVRSHRGQLVPGRQRDDQIAMRFVPRAPRSRFSRHSGMR